MASDAIDLAANDAQDGRWSFRATEIQGADRVTARDQTINSNSLAVVESRSFLAECIRQCLQVNFASLQVLTYLDVGEFGASLSKALPKVILLSIEENGGEVVNALQFLSRNLPNVPVIVLSNKNDADLARIAIGHGAKGFIPVTTGFKIVLEAVRFVLFGGTYVPTDCLFSAKAPCAQANPLVNSITTRELAVVRAIQQGKSNKVIAYDLNMCESTVKVHLRNIMKKMGARNRTDVAIKAQSYLPERMTTSNLTIAA